MLRTTLNLGLGTGKVDKNSVYPTTTVDQQTLIDGLNHDLAGEYQAIIMDTHYPAKLTRVSTAGSCEPFRRPKFLTNRGTRSSSRKKLPTWGANRRPTHARFVMSMDLVKCWNNKR